MQFQAVAIEQIHDDYRRDDSELIFREHEHAIAHPYDQILADSFDVVGDLDFSFALGTEPGISGKAVTA